jgi:MFS family permease
MAVFQLATIVPYLLVGAWGDRVGLRRGLLFGAALYAAAHLLLLICEPLSGFLALPAWLVFLSLRVVAGFGGGAITVTANGLGAALYPPGQRGRSLSFVWLGVPLALVVGVPLPAFLARTWADLPDGARRWLADPYATVAFVVALGVLLLVPAVVPVAPARSAAGAAADRSVPSLRKTWSVLLTSLLMPFAVFELLASSAPHTQQAFGFTPAQQGVLFVLLGAGSVAGGVFSGALADRFGRRRCLLGSLIGFALLVPVLPWCDANAFRAGGMRKAAQSAEVLDTVERRYGVDRGRPFLARITPRRRSASRRGSSAAASWSAASAGRSRGLGGGCSRSRAPAAARPAPVRVAAFRSNRRSHGGGRRSVRWSSRLAGRRAAAAPGALPPLRVVVPFARDAAEGLALVRRARALGVNRASIRCGGSGRPSCSPTRCSSGSRQEGCAELGGRGLRADAADVRHPPADRDRVLGARVTGRRRLDPPGADSYRVSSTRA